MIIFLNGTSSAGKTSIAKALQQILDAPYVHMAIDTFLNMVPTQYWDTATSDPHNSTFVKIISGFHHAIAAMATAGNQLIVDHVLEEPQWLEECVELFAGFQVVFVGVHCSLEELEQRESVRSDRAVGLARYQFDRVHASRIYDVEVDTSRYSPMECALSIREYLQNTSTPQGFQQIRSLLGRDCE